MIPETENPQEVKRVCRDQPARNAQADLGRHFTQCSDCQFSRGTAHIYIHNVIQYLPSVVKENDLHPEWSTQALEHISVEYLLVEDTKF